MKCCNDNERKTVRSEEDKKILNNRLNRIIGQMNGIKVMINNDRYCDDILIQLLAIEKAIKSVSTIILEHHMHNCLIEKIKNGETEAVDEILNLFKKS